MLSSSCLAAVAVEAPGVGESVVDGAKYPAAVAAAAMYFVVDDGDKFIVFLEKWESAVSQTS